MTVPIVSKKSESMTEKIASSAVTVPRRVKNPKSIRPNVEKSGACTSAWGSWAAPGVANPFQPASTPLRTTATTVVTTIPIRSAPRTRRGRQAPRADEHKPATNHDAGTHRRAPEPAGKRRRRGLDPQPGGKKSKEGEKDPSPPAARPLGPGRPRRHHRLAKAREDQDRDG